jgi:Rod binding domain-containing protein
MNVVPPVGTPKADPRAQLRQASHDLEAVFYGQLLQSMRDTVPDSGGMFEKSQGEQMFTSMLDDQISKLASGRSEHGLAESLYRQMSRHLGPEPSPETSTGSTSIDRSRI